MEREKYFKNLRADNIEQFYRNNFSLWFIHNSEYTKFNDEPIGGMKKEVRAITNLLGLRTDNITASKNDVSGFEIKEPEFIEYEKDKIVFLLNNNTNSQLKRKLKHYLEFIQAKESQFKTSQPHQIEEKEEKLSLKQIALIHAYTKSNITDHNKNDIAKKNGWNSGHKLK